MMKSYLLFSSIIFVAVNLLAGLLLTSYSQENVLMSTGVIVANTILLLAVSSSSIKSPFKLSMSIIFPVFALLEFVLTIISPNRYQDNGYLVAVILCFTFQVVCFVTIISVSRRNNEIEKYNDRM